MSPQLLTEKYAESLDGVLGGYDRIVITGSLAELCYAKGMTHYLYAHDTRIVDYAQWAEPLRDAIRTNAEAVADAHALTIEYISKKTFARKTAFRRSWPRAGAHLQCHGTVCVIPALA